MVHALDKRKKLRAQPWRPRDPAQFKRLIEAARALGVAIDEKAANKTLRGLARHKVKPGND